MQQFFSLMGTKAKNHAEKALKRSHHVMKVNSSYLSADSQQ